MKKIKEFDKQTLKALRTELDAVLAKFENKAGIEIKTGKIRYTSSTINVGLEGKVIGGKSIEAQALELFTEFKENDIIRIRQIGEVKVVGYKSRNKKYPFIIEDVNNGKRYKLSKTQIDNRVEVV